MDLNTLKSLLQNYSIVDLQRHIDSSICDSLLALSIRFTPKGLSEALITCYGYGFFNHKRLRKMVIENLNRKQLEILLRSFNLTEDASYETKDQIIKAINNFSWGNNQKSLKILEILGLDPDLFIQKKITKTPSVEIISPVNKTNIENWKFLLHPYQENVRKQISSFLINDDKKLIVHMPTGAGKTRTMMESLCDFYRMSSKTNSLAVWMAYSDELCTQAVDSFIERWELRGTEPLQIIRFWGGRKLPEMDPNIPTLVVTSFDTCYASLYSKRNKSFEFFAKLKRLNSLTVVDEAHQAPAPTYADAIKTVTGAAKLIGLTATPGRGGGENSNRVSEFFNKNKITLSGKYAEPNPIRYLQDQRILSEVSHYELEGSKINIPEKHWDYIAEKLQIPDEISKIIAEDTSRNISIIQQIIELAEREKQTIVFAVSVLHAQLLTICLKTQGINAACIEGGTPYSERVNSINRFKDNKIKVLINFGVLTTGFDAPKTDAVVIARPTLSVVLYSQMLGRGIRGIKMGGTKECIIVNVKDNFLNLPNVDQAFTYFERDWIR
jgi:DNA repair protein RadD